MPLTAILLVRTHRKFAETMRTLSDAFSFRLQLTRSMKSIMPWWFLSSNSSSSSSDVMFWSFNRCCDALDNWWWYRCNRLAWIDSSRTSFSSSASPAVSSVTVRLVGRKSALALWLINVIDESFVSVDEENNEGNESKLELSGNFRVLVDFCRLILFVSSGGCKCEELFTFKLISLLCNRFCRRAKSVPWNSSPKSILKQCVAFVPPLGSPLQIDWECSNGLDQRRKEKQTDSFSGSTHRSRSESTVE